MALTLKAGGPVEAYLHATGKSIKTFEADLRQGDPASASILSGDVLYGAIQDLVMAFENLTYEIAKRDAG